MSALMYRSVGLDNKGKLWISRGMLGLIYFNILSTFLLKLLLVLRIFRRKYAEDEDGMGWGGRRGVKINKIV